MNSKNEQPFNHGETESRQDITDILPELDSDFAYFIAGLGVLDYLYTPLFLDEDTSPDVGLTEQISESLQMPDEQSVTETRQEITDTLSIFPDVQRSTTDIGIGFEQANSPGDDWSELSDSQDTTPGIDTLPELDSDFAYFIAGLGFLDYLYTPLFLEEDTSPDVGLTEQISESLQILDEQSVKEETFKKYINFRFFCTRELSGKKALDYHGDAFQFDDKLMRPLVQRSKNESGQENEVQSISAMSNP